MKIAIIGAGAAGMSTAYLLNKHHDITIFERQSIIGGNIRTLNKNVQGTQLDTNLILDCGVLEFQSGHFPNFHKLMNRLNITMAQGETSSELFLANGHCYKSGAGLMHHSKNFNEFLNEAQKLSPVVKGYMQFLLAEYRVTSEDLYDKTVSTYLDNDIHAVWLKMLLMYAYSMPYQKIADFPAEIAIPLLRHSTMFTKWDRMVGGVYTYIEKILDQFDGTIHCSAKIDAVYRTDTGIIISTASRERLFFDKVIFAVTPEQVLNLLGDANADEIRRFAAWQENKIETLIHTDISFYEHFGVSYYSEFDVFQTDAHGQCGYNAYLNRLYDIDPMEYSHYSLAYNLGAQIDSKTIIHKQDHNTPLYSVEALRYRHEIIETNGDNHTFHAGAYLGNGLHEGAITSAYSVSDLLTGSENER